MKNHTGILKPHESLTRQTPKTMPLAGNHFLNVNPRITPTQSVTFPKDTKIAFALLTCFPKMYNAAQRWRMTQCW